MPPAAASPRLAILPHPADAIAWRRLARAALGLGLAPEDVEWQVDGAGEVVLLAGAPLSLEDIETAPPLRVPPAFVAAAEEGVQHSDPARFALLYALLHRIHHGERRLMERAADPQVHRLHTLRKAVRRDAHKMKAFVRFRSVEGRELSDGVEGAVAAVEAGGMNVGGALGMEAAGSMEDADYVAWFEPEHHVLRATAPFFMRRFTDMRWAIVTPGETAVWDGETLSFGPGGVRDDAPPEDAWEDAWRAYYSAIFNPARLMTKAMKAEMPIKYWRNLPEARLIRPLIQDAGRRAEQMVERAREARLGQPSLDAETAEPVRGTVGAGAERDDSPGVDPHIPPSVSEFPMPAPTTTPDDQDDLFGAAEPEPAPARDAVPEAESLDALEAAARACELCPLYAPATQTVFGEGPADAPLMFIGEQPGDKEDQAGRPFVGPAGQVFDRALGDAGIDRGKVYVTNAVKHFKFVPRGPRRIHQKPDVSEIKACNVWLQKEIQAVRPAMLVALGATAGRAVFGREIGVMKTRGTVFDLDETLQAYVTVHPSFLLRLPDPEQKRMEYNRFLADLRRIADAVPQSRVA